MDTQEVADEGVGVDVGVDEKDEMVEARTLEDEDIISLELDNVVDISALEKYV